MVRDKGTYQPLDKLTSGYDVDSVLNELGNFAWSQYIFSDTLHPMINALLESIETDSRQNVRCVDKLTRSVQ
ncbi:hypothetical protein PsYK624_062350 [Phanerochaete sordida]|uniref:Uncharacterized protein n=1 Tax=Phanerochaete sordida TaxID=48140 RepID=A0A9P3G6E2_9APHY|nr:hypothetical protein PsYK624_062350 [Phanerochaete sordida]